MFYEPEKAVIVKIEIGESKTPLAESLEELKRLAATAGAVPVGRITQKREKPDSKFYLGSGKVEELRSIVAALNADLVVFGNELTASQERNLENFLGTKVIDHTELILDIFAQHAKSREGALQVELAQSTFRLTRLIGHGVMMSRLGGGIGTRGPGETKLEYDRRKIRKRISELKKEIGKVRRERALRREKRKKSKIPSAALVGYTNSGKSTLLNALTGSSVLADDKLFATLDPTVRRLYLPSKGVILLTDTVGFINDLPHQLVAAFHATLEEVTESDILLHVVDISNPGFERQIGAVYTVLEELKCAAKPTITIFNKIDRLENGIPEKIFKEHSPAIAVSAFRQKNLEEIGKLLSRHL